MASQMSSQSVVAHEVSGDDSLYPIAVLIDELRNDDVQVCRRWTPIITKIGDNNRCFFAYFSCGSTQSANCRQ